MATSQLHARLPSIGTSQLAHTVRERFQPTEARTSTRVVVEHLADEDREHRALARGALECVAHGDGHRRQRERLSILSG